MTHPSASASEPAQPPKPFAAGSGARYCHFTRPVWRSSAIPPPGCRIAGANVLVRLEVVSHDCRVRTLSFGRKRNFDVERPAWPNKTSHSMGDRLVVLDVFQTLDRAHEISPAKRRRELWIQEVTLPKCEIRKIDPHLMDPKIDPQDRGLRKQAREKRLVKTLAAPNRDDRRRVRLRASRNGVQQMNEAEQPEPGVETE